jgi:SAM-dependent methyltransferase
MSHSCGRRTVPPMHDTAYKIGGIFLRTYAKSGDHILDIGSMDVNGSLRALAPPDCRYVGIDLEAGPGVDIVVGRISQLPFAPASFDAIVTSSCFEHDAMFWQTFVEMCRVLKPAGYIYINAPSKGYMHSYPIDAWRFFPDAGIALRDWAKINFCAVELVESFITRNIADIWNDCVMVFTKGDPPPSGEFISNQYDLAINVRQWPRLTEIQRHEIAW